MVDPWEVEQRDYTRTLFVLQRVRRKLDQLFNQQPGHHGGTTLGAAPQGCPPKAPKVVLVCGADVVESMADPSIWRQDLLEQLLTEHGVVCISRDGAGVAAGAQLEQPGTLLNRHQANVLLVQDPVPNEVSSSAVRHELEQGRSVKYLLPDAVIEYVHRHGLYGVGGERHKSGWMGSWGGSKVDKEQDS